MTQTDPTGEQIEQYGRDGFLIVERWLSDDEVERTRERFHACFEHEWETGLAPDEVNYTPGVTPPDRTRQLCNVWKADRWLAHITLAEREWAGGNVAQAQQLLKGTQPDLREQWVQRNPELNEEMKRRVTEMQRTGELRTDVDADEIGRFLGLLLDGIAVQVSAPVSVVSVTGTAIVVSAASATVAGTLSFSSGNTILTFTPSNPLAVTQLVLTYYLVKASALALKQEGLRPEAIEAVSLLTGRM